MLRSMQIASQYNKRRVDGCYLAGDRFQSQTLFGGIPKTGQHAQKMASTAVLAITLSQQRLIKIRGYLSCDVKTRSFLQPHVVLTLQYASGVNNQ